METKKEEENTRKLGIVMVIILILGILTLISKCSGLI